jgi:hypothetical protein
MLNRRPTWSPAFFAECNESRLAAIRFANLTYASVRYRTDLRLEEPQYGCIAKLK